MRGNMKTREQRQVPGALIAKYEEQRNIYIWELQGLWAGTNNSDWKKIKRYIMNLETRISFMYKIWREYRKVERALVAIKGDEGMMFYKP